MEDEKDCCFRPIDQNGNYTSIFPLYNFAIDCAHLYLQELALMHAAKRSATVTCKNSVELLAVGREDFVDIFMPMDKDQEPEHIRFLRTVQLLKGWPIERLPYHDPKICCFTYFRFV